NEPRQHDRLRAVVVEEHLCAVDVVALEQPRLGPAEHRRTGPAADHVADLRAHHGGDEHPRQDDGQVEVDGPVHAGRGQQAGREFVVESSIGHIRDLPRRAADVPAAYKGEPWARLGVDVDNGFKPLYVLSSEKRQQVAKLRSLLKDASELYLATDEDREGESI